MCFVGPLSKSIAQALPNPGLLLAVTNLVTKMLAKTVQLRP